MGKNVVVPDHFKVRGREPQGREVAHEVERQQYAQTEKNEARARAGRSKAAKTKGESSRKKG